MPVCFEPASASARGDHVIPAVAASLENIGNRDQCISPPRIPLFANCLPTAMPSRSHSRSNIVRHSGLQAGQYKQSGFSRLASLCIVEHIHTYSQKLVFLGPYLRLLGQNGTGHNTLRASCL